MIRLTIAAESATVSRDPRGVRVDLRLSMSDIVKALSEHLEDVPDFGNPVPESALRRQIVDPLLRSLEPVDAVKLVERLVSFDYGPVPDAATFAAVSRLVSGVCKLARLNPDDAELRAVVHQMRQESGIALCPAVPASFREDEKTVSVATTEGEKP